ncbi:sugar translocase [Bacillus sp. AFS002410]|uniref:GtrA family protein n=1 Tax=Bacillus sp. AFS002410 TaxID=2033481 RepID=UPI000BEF6288|nr:GtrA family protein [Bacillus sp. AFS002410]PEJ57795.1 sugar translocase [Bacillus sp. AFS002410]
MINQFKGFVKFGIVGLINTGVDFIVFTLLIYAVTNIPYLVAQMISYSCGIVNSYLLNKRWTFKAKNQSSVQEKTRFVIVNVITLLLTLLILKVCSEWFGLSVLASKLMATCISVLMNYVGSRYWVFTSSKVGGI